MARLFPSSSTTRTLQALAAIAVLVAFCLMALRMMAPDPTATLYAKARRLELAGQLNLALRHYALLSDKHPDSPYAPQALEQQGEILAGLGRRENNPELFRHALECYQRIADVYPENRRSGDALSAAGSIALNDLRDTKKARGIYQALLDRFPTDVDYASEATLRMGRIAIDENDGKSAQTWLHRVIQQYPRVTQRCAEAQYFLGVAYETLFKNRDWAQNAYIATVKRYPQSVWAADAKQHLGLLVYAATANQPQARRVLIETQPLPHDTASEDSLGDPLLSVLRVLLAARGIEVDATSFRGWSLAPFWAAFDPANPSRVLKPRMNSLDNILACAGLTYSPASRGLLNKSLPALQASLNDGHAPLVYNGQWMLAVGYDTSRDEIYFRKSGARLETLGVKEFVEGWKTKLPGGGPYTMVDLRAPGDRAHAKPTPRPVGLLTGPTPGGAEAGAAPTPTPALTVPTFVFELRALSARNAHRRAIRRAVISMHDVHTGKALLNLAALDALANELERLAQPPSAQASPIPEKADDGKAATPDPTRPPVPVATKAVPLHFLAPRARALAGWFHDPLAQWVVERRDAAAYCDMLGTLLHDSNLQLAADDWRASIAALQNAASALPAADDLSHDDLPLSAETRLALGAVAREVRNAHDAEKRATQEMAKFAG